jgi:UDP-N-acetylglucosamine--N-acetylmuramyl-(pentapeptide) pyrophosphoryl-undecaprenol N-acetylglucosamine transferase
LNRSERNIKVIITGGGTGGHIFPAISIADELKFRNDNTEILFVGAKGRMEMESVPIAGYKIIGLPVSGIQRRLTFKNFGVAINLVRSLMLARKILQEFRPTIVIGVGGYASGPLLRVAAMWGIPALLQEQNSYAGVTNRLLAKHASTICVAYNGMEKYFPKEKIVITGNPVRSFRISNMLRQEGFDYFALERNKPVLLVIGGSLGARTINESMLDKITVLSNSNIQIIWQTGKYYFDEIKEKTSYLKGSNIHVHDFISRMDMAYNVADLLISRAGAISLSEICLMGRPAILVPSPNVAEDHQTKNAMALVKEEAAIMVRDKDAKKELIVRVMELMNDEDLRKKLAKNCKKMAKPESTARIVDEVYKLI